MTSPSLQKFKRWAALLRAEGSSLGHSLESYAMDWEADLSASREDRRHEPAAGEAQPLTDPIEAPPLPRGEVMASGVISGVPVSLVRYTESDIRGRDEWWRYRIEQEQARVRAERAHRLNFMLEVERAIDGEPSVCSFKETDRLRAALATQPAPVAPEDAFEAGWTAAANWAGRGDLLADVGSPAYQRDRGDAMRLLGHPAPSAAPAQPVAADGPRLDGGSMRDKNDPDERWLDEFVRLKKAGKVVLDRDEWKAKLEDAYNDGRQSVDAAQTQAYIDGRNDQREEALQIPTGATPMPAGWVPLTLEWEPGYPEDVAFGPKRMMDRLKKWLDKHFARVVADRNAEDGWGAPDARKTWQGGLTNEELEQWWRLKLPNVEAKNRDISVFALGVEVGAGMGSAPKPDAALAVLREGSNPKGECPPGPRVEPEEPGPQDAPKNDSPPAEQAAREVSEPNPWRQAVDAALVSAGLDCLAPDAEAVPSLMALLARRVRIALDPAVSEEAQALIERGRESAPSVQVVEPEACTYPTCTGDAPADGGCCEKPFREHCQYPKACRASDPRGCNVFTCGGVVAQASALPAAQQPAVEPVARVVVHKTGGNAGIAWSAVPVEDAPLMRDGDFLYTSPAAHPAAPDVVADARRYRQIRDNPWSDELHGIITLHLNALWDVAIDAELDRAEGEKQ